MAKFFVPIFIDTTDYPMVIENPGVYSSERDAVHALVDTMIEYHSFSLVHRLEALYDEFDDTDASSPEYDILKDAIDMHEEYEGDDDRYCEYLKSQVDTLTDLERAFDEHGLTCQKIQLIVNEHDA